MSVVCALDKYVELGILSSEDRAILREAVLARWNVLMAGGMAFGIATLGQSLFLEITKICSAERVAVLEDTVQAIVLDRLRALPVLDGSGGTGQSSGVGNRTREAPASLHLGGAMRLPESTSASPMAYQQEINPHGLYATADVARILGLHPDTVYRIPRAVLRRTPVGPRGGRIKIMGSDLLLYLRRK